ncbi:MAG: hypothetical protein IKU70_06180 [Clostridia bacterium]|nr:hypothetical protein [Clostridia bacterium]
MRLLILWPDFQTACAIRNQMEGAGWDAVISRDGREILQSDQPFDLALLHLCLSGLDGLSAGNALARMQPVCPPRIVFAAPSEWCVHRPFWADCTVDSGVSVTQLCRLLQTVAQKPLSKLAAANSEMVSAAVRHFLDDLGFKSTQKGRAYAAWLLERMIPASVNTVQVLYALYGECARHFDTTSAAVERCLRVAVERVFTQGSLCSIERYFGATVDPERGKPTNRAFLMQAAQQLRYSLTATRSLNKSEMHHSPAAPTSV